MPNLTHSLKIGSGMGQKNFKGAVSINNAEGRIRLRWRYLTKRYSLSLCKNSQIRITEVMARTVNGTHAAARVRKETKNGKERALPLIPDLLSILEPIISGKQPDDLLFQSVNGLSIDDRMFQRRIFKPILKELKIEERVLYACRHTFGSRCIDSGITPVMTAFLIGNNHETALRNYTHQLNIPKELPLI